MLAHAAYQYCAAVRGTVASVATVATVATVAEDLECASRMQMQATTFAVGW